jgi:dipeptidase
MLRALGIFGSLALQTRFADGCTTLAVSAGASRDGSTITTHTNDCADCDTRMAYIPARDWPEGSMRPVYISVDGYPRFVGNRSDVYAPKPGQKLSQPIGHIPQVSHTYAYWENGYGYSNEHGLTLGESTCAAKFFSTQATALLDITQLTQLSMERCRTARCAITTIGPLAEEHGFLNEDPGNSGGGEALSIADGKELWIFHITSGPGGRGAMWAAQRVPDGHMSMVANNFVIREVDCDDGANFLCSSDLLAATKAAGVWDGTGKLDFTKAIAEDIMTFSYFKGFSPIPEYTSGRLWRVFSRVAPSLGLQMSRDPLNFPFSVPVDQRLSARDVMDLQRDHYEGTELDLTVGADAGPFGTPNRAELGVGMSIVKGQYARAISLHRTAFAIMGQSYGDRDTGISKIWFGADTPASSVFVPFYPKTSLSAPEYQTGWQGDPYDDQSAWWVFDFVANWMDLNHRLMKVDVDAKIAELQDEIDAECAVAERHAASALQEGRPAAAIDSLTEFQLATQSRTVDTWRKFGRFLIMKYNDMYLNYPVVGTHIGYPAWYLEMNGFDSDPRPKWTQPSSKEPELYKVLGPGPFEKLTPALEKVAKSSESYTAPVQLSAASAGTGGADATGTTLLILLTAAMAFAGGLFVGRRTSVTKSEVGEWGASPYVQAPTDARCRW